MVCKPDIPYSITQDVLQVFSFRSLLYTELHTECPRRNGQNFGRVFLMLKYTDITQNTYIQS